MTNDVDSYVDVVKLVVCTWSRAPYVSLEIVSEDILLEKGLGMAALDFGYVWESFCIGYDEMDDRTVQ